MNFISALQESVERDPLNVVDQGKQHSQSWILHQCYLRGFDLHQSLAQIIWGTPDLRKPTALAITEFAQQWCSFVTKYRPKGKGHRPTWATQGFNFLMFAMEPGFTNFLTDEHFCVSINTNFKFILKKTLLHQRMIQE